MFKPELVIVAQGQCTEVVLGGKKIGKGIRDFEYSARDNKGNLNPTIKLLGIDVSEFEYEDADDFLESLADVNKMQERAIGIKNDIQWGKAEPK